MNINQISKLLATSGVKHLVVAAETVDTWTKKLKDSVASFNDSLIGMSVHDEHIHTYKHVAEKCDVVRALSYSIPDELTTERVDPVLVRNMAAAFNLGIWHFFEQEKKPKTKQAKKYASEVEIHRSKLLDRLKHLNTETYRDYILGISQLMLDICSCDNALIALKTKLEIKE